MTRLQKLTLGLSLIATTHLMGAKSAPESMGNITYNKANINCEADGKKNFIVDTVEMDNIGFDYTKFISKLESKMNVKCKIYGNIELPDDISTESVDIEVPESIRYLYGNGANYYKYSTFLVNNALDESVLLVSGGGPNSSSFRPARYTNVPILSKAGKKYIEISVITIQYAIGMFGYNINIPGTEVNNFFKNSENYNVKLLKAAQKRNETAETISLDKFFIFERKKK